MSVKVMGKVWDLELPHNKLIVLLAMADHADHEGNNVFPSQGLVAWKTGYSIDQVRRIQRALVKDGLLKVESNAPGKPIKYSIDLTMGKLKAPYTPSIAVQDLAGCNPLHDDATPTPSIAVQDPTPSIAVQDEPSGKPSFKPSGEKRAALPDPFGNSMNAKYAAYLDTWRNAHDGVKPLALRGKQRTDALDDVQDLIDMGVTHDDLKAFIQERQKNGKSTSWNLMVRDIHEFMTRKQKKAAIAATIPTINGNVVYIEATDQTMIWDADHSRWDTYPGKLESRPA